MTTDLTLLLVPPDMPLIEATARMSTNGKRMVIVADSERRLLGVVADYDVRKAILDHRDFTRPVSDFMIANPTTVPAGTSEDALRQLFEATGHYQIPLVDGQRRLVGVRFLDEFVAAASPRRADVAVIMAGGRGERLHPLTLDTPKPLLPVGGRPILFNILDQLLSEGFKRIYICANYMADAIIRAIDAVPRYREHAVVVVENERMGTAGALSLLPERPQSAFLVLNGDLLTNLSFRDLLTFHGERGNCLTMAIKHETFRVPYGVAEVEDMRITGLVEKPEYQHFVNAGVYALEPEMLDMLSPGQFTNMTDIVQDLIAKGLRVGGFPVYDFWLDIGTPDQFERAQLEYAAFKRTP